MALFTTPEEHAANPPTSWIVTKCGSRSWVLTTTTNPSAPLDHFDTKREAEQARVDGWLVRLYRDEGQWFAGKPVAGWRSRD